MPPPSSNKCQKHVTMHLPPSNLPPLLPTPNIPPSTLPPLLPTPNTSIYTFPHTPNHDQQMHILSKHKAYTHSTHPMGFKNTKMDASIHKVKNTKDPHALGHKYRKSKKSPSKMLSKPIPSQAKSKTQMVWVPIQKSSMSNEASTSQKSQSSPSIQNSHSVQKFQIPKSHRQNKNHKNSKSMWVPKCLHHPSPKKTSPLLPSTSKASMFIMVHATSGHGSLPFHNISTYLHHPIFQLLSYISSSSYHYGP